MREALFGLQKERLTYDAETAANGRTFAHGRPNDGHGNDSFGVQSLGAFDMPSAELYRNCGGGGGGEGWFRSVRIIDP
jgi:hypothetical protein